MLNTNTQTQPQLSTLVALPSLLPPLERAGDSAQPLTIDYLSVVFGTLLDTVFPFHGFLLLDAQGTLMQSSPYAQTLMHQLAHDFKQARSLSPVSDSQPANRTLPPAVEHLMHCLQESRQLL